MGLGMGMGLEPNLYPLTPEKCVFVSKFYFLIRIYPKVRVIAGWIEFAAKGLK